jgi:hypothetical protein
MISICRQLLQGQDLETICAKPPMPLGPVFLGWVEDHAEACAIYRSVHNFQSIRPLVKELGVFPTRATPGEWEEQIRANCERGWPADWIERKYTPPDWNKVYQLLGRPPVWSTEDIEAYTEMLNGFTEMLEPRDMMELTWTKEAADATWEVRRMVREKNSLPEQKYQERLRVLAQVQRQRGAAEGTAAKPATAFDHSLGLQAGCKYYQAFDIAQARAIKRRDNALRMIVRWRDSLGAKARRLSDKFIAEQALVERYGATELVAEADAIAGDSVQAALRLASAGEDCRRRAAGSDGGRRRGNCTFAHFRSRTSGTCAPGGSRGKANCHAVACRYRDRGNWGRRDASRISPRFRGRRCRRCAAGPAAGRRRENCTCARVQRRNCGSCGAAACFGRRRGRRTARRSRWRSYAGCTPTRAHG